MKKIRFLIPTGLIPFFFVASGQDHQVFKGEKQFLGDFKSVSRAIDYSKISGSPYESASLTEGTIRFRAGNEIQTYLRYNIYTDEMEYLDGTTLMIVSNVFDIREIELGDLIYEYSDYIVKLGLTGVIQKGYLVREVEGACTVYRKMDVRLQKELPPKSGYDSPRPATFVRESDSWLIAFNGGRPKLIFLDKNILQREFRQPDVLEQWAKDQKLKVKKPENFIEIVKFHNEFHAK
ncbi:MAG: hypothetical protein RIM99_14990 [Cyclobacteriaceae bacterium]